MKNYLVWMPLVIVLGLTVVLGDVLASGRDPSAIATPLMGETAPDLDVAMFGQPGKHVTGDDLRGKPLLVNFFASWCGPCAAENELLMQMAQDEHIRIVGIAMKDNADALKDYLDKRGNPYALIGLDETGHTSIDWGVSGVPETFLVDGKGKILERHVGQLDGQEGRHLIERLKDAS